MPSATTHRSTAKKTTKKPNGASTASSKLPAALAARATAAASAKTSRLRSAAHALLALISRRKREITEAFYDIGEALTKLKDRDTISALGRRSFAEVCEKDAGISVTVAERLVEIVRSLTREQALAMGQKKAMAMVTLAAATPEDDTAAGLYRKKSIALPGGKKVSPRSASANEIEEAATAIRHRRSASAAKSKGNGSAAPGRGRTTTAEERTFAALLERRLHQLGLDRARVTRRDQARAGERSPLRAHPRRGDRRAQEGDRALSRTRTNPYRLANGIAIAESWEMLLSAPLGHAINVDEKGQDVTGTGDVWSNTSNDGKTAKQGENEDCANWTKSSGFGNVGELSSNINWSSNGTNVSCGLPTRIYCFEE